MSTDGSGDNSGQVPEQSETQRAGSPSGDDGAPRPDDGAPRPDAAPRGTMIDFMSANKIETALWGTRMATVIFTVAFVLPIFGGNPFTHFQRALISNAATSALRLHQRLPRFQLSREFFALMLLEDSCHYLFYSIMFLNSHPITMVLTPVFLFALLHATSFTKKLLDQMGPTSIGVARNLIHKLELQQRNILRFIGCNEIFLMPVTVMLIFMGKTSLILPFFYHRFLSLRYTSRRNPYARQLFYELRITVEYLIQQPQCPTFITNLTYKAIALVIRIAPQQVPQQQ